MTCENANIQLGGTARTPQHVVCLHRLGLQFAEVPIKDPSLFTEQIEGFLAVQKETGLRYLCHGPREGDPNYLHALETVYFPKLVGVMELMSRLNMSQLNVHLWLDPRFVKKQSVRYKIDFLRRLIARGERSGITVCLENLSESAAHLAEVFAALPALKMTLDLGHAQLLSEENTSYGFFEKFPQRIRHIHLHDNRGGDSQEDDLHLPVGEGTIDFVSIFRALHKTSYRGTITLELRPDEIERCLDYVKRLLRS